MKVKRNIKKLGLLLTISLLHVSCGKKIEEKPRKPKTGHITNRQSTDSDLEESQNPSVNLELLYNAILANDTSLVEAALNNVDQLNFTFINGETPLTMALKVAKNEIISLIIEKTDNLNTFNKDGHSPLHLAIIYNKFLSFSNLIDSGATLDIKNKEGHPPIYYTLSQGGERYFIQLAIKGARLSINMANGKIALLDWLKNLNFEKALELYDLIKEHQSVDISHLIKSIKLSNTNFLTYLLENFEYYQNYIKTNNVLNYTLDIEDGSKRLNMLEKLLVWGANPNINQGETPSLIYAFKAKDFKAIELLSIYKADVTVLDDMGKNILDYAVQTLNFDILELLLTPIKSTFSSYSNSEQEKYLSAFKKSCELVPEDEEEVNMGYVTYMRLKNRITHLLECRISP